MIQHVLAFAKSSPAVRAFAVLDSYADLNAENLGRTVTDIQMGDAWSERIDTEGTVNGFVFDYPLLFLIPKGGAIRLVHSGGCKIKYTRYEVGISWQYQRKAEADQFRARWFRTYLPTVAELMDSLAGQVDSEGRFLNFTGNQMVVNYRPELSGDSVGVIAGEFIVEI